MSEFESGGSKTNSVVAMTRVTWRPGFLTINEVLTFLSESNMLSPYIVAHYIGVIPEHGPSTMHYIGQAEATFCGTLEEWKSVLGTGHFISGMFHGHSHQVTKCLARSEDPRFYASQSYRQDPSAMWELDVNDNLENTLVLGSGIYCLPCLGITVSSN